MFFVHNNLWHTKQISQKIDLFILIANSEMTDKYLCYDCNSAAGLDHHTLNLKTLLSEAALLNRIPVIPIFHFAANHNHGVKIKNHLDKYYDLHQIKIGGQPVKVILSSNISISKNSDKSLSVAKNKIISNEQNQQFDFITRELKGADDGWWHIFQENYNQDLLSITIPTNDKILTIASKASKILKNYQAIHVRRSDRLCYPLMNYYTSPKAIIRKLSKTIPDKSTLYLMSDERKPGFFDEIGKHYQLKRWFDLEPVKDATAEFADDNYFLYKIEMAIFNQADIKIISLYGNSTIKLYPDFVLKINTTFHKFIGNPYRKFILFVYNIKPIKFVFKSIYRRDKIY